LGIASDRFGVSLTLSDYDRPALLFWLGLVPEQIAVDQARWEGRRQVVKMRQAGLTFKEIGRIRNVSIDRARQIFLRGQEEVVERSPVEKYLSEEPIKGFPDGVVWRNTWRHPQPE
jgi:hypothetical protein